MINSLSAVKIKKDTNWIKIRLIINITAGYAIPVRIPSEKP